MMSDFKATKFYFENMFAQLWTDTKIHFMYQEFEGIDDAWVNVIYHPSRLTSASLNKNTGRVMSTVGVVCWAETDVDVLDLADKVIQFMNNNVDTNVFALGQVDIIDQGVDGSNKAFIYLSFSVASYHGACIEPHAIVNRGIPIVDAGVPVVD